MASFFGNYGTNPFLLTMMSLLLVLMSFKRILGQRSLDLFKIWRTSAMKKIIKTKKVRATIRSKTNSKNK